MTAINTHHEIDSSKLTRDTRTAGERFFASLYSPGTFRFTLVVLIALFVWEPGFWPAWIITVWLLVMGFEDQKFRMPLRMPKDAGGLDQTDYKEEMVEQRSFFGLFRSARMVRTLFVAGGILYLGYLRTPDTKQFGRELWLNDSDARTHMFLAGTTGSGKTKALCGLVYNALCWGSGCTYGDGKASVTLPWALWSMCRRLGREDDFLCQNFLTGAEDPFKRMVAQERGGGLSERALLAQSNGANAFSDGSSDFLLQLLASLLPKASGDGLGWRDKAINLVDAILRTLCYKRARSELVLTIGVIRHYLALHNLVQFYIDGREGRLPENAFLPIKSYFETGLPGFNPDLAKEPGEWDPDVFSQHGYLAGQLSRTLAMMMDSYGHIFGEEFAEIDPLDCVLNNRIVVVLIPSLEKSPNEAAAVGQLHVATQRLAMAKTLGHQIEGTKAQVLDARPSNRPNPYLIISDEIGYWFAEGLGVMSAQARELGYMMVFSAQDVQGMKRAAAGDETDSIIANTKVKWTLALEDPEDTFDIIRKAGGEANYAMLSGHDASPGTFTSGYAAQDTTSIERRDRIELQELKKLNPGEGLVIYKGSVLPSSALYLSDDQLFSSKLPARLNRFLQVRDPSFDRMPKSAQVLDQHRHDADRIVAQIRRGRAPYFPLLEDPILDAVVSAASHLNEVERYEVSATERGIVLFEAARKAMRACRAAHRPGHMHEGHHDNPPELFPPTEDEEVPEFAYLD